MGILARWLREGADEEPSSRAQVRALISEIWMLVDYVAGRPSQGLGAIEVSNAQKPGAKLTPAELLRVVSDTEGRLAAAGNIEPYDRAQMQIVRDALNVLVRPASGLTVAYTTMVTGPLRRRAASRVNLAQDAYGNLAGPALRHRWYQRAILALAILFTLMAAWESAKVAFGKALLQNLDLLRAEQAALSAEKVKFEMSLGPPAAAPASPEVIGEASPPLASYRLCDRATVQFARTHPHPSLVQQVIQQIDPTLPPLSYGTAGERDICGRDDILKVNLGIVRTELKAYNQNWAGMVGSLFAFSRNLLTCGRPSCGDAGQAGLQPGQEDVEFRIVPVLLVWGNFVLPIIFGFIGSALFVILDYYQKIKDSTLHPRDSFLAPVRLALGLVVGACVGLFSSSYVPVQPAAGTQNAAALIATLTLTASGVAFLAGFGVEAVFSLLQSLISRVFTLQAQAK